MSYSLTHAAFIHGEQHRYTYFMRTLGNIAENLKPLDRTIDDEFLTALFGRDITADDRELLSIQVREGVWGFGDCTPIQIQHIRHRKR